MLTADSVKRFAKSCGADLVGIGSMDRFEGSPPQWDPRHILPEAKSIIGLAFRIHRGLLRGIEEGTYFGGYPSAGYAMINDVHAPIVLRDVGSFIEDHGYESVLFPNSAIRYGFNSGRPVAPGKPAPDVFVHSRISGFICGMGEIGYSSIFLTPEFGPRQRLMFIVTDAPLKADPLHPGGLCDKCMLCVRDCPGKAISRTDTVTISVAGRTLERGRLDEFRCSTAFQSSSPEYSPFMDAETRATVQDVIDNGDKAELKDIGEYRFFTRPGHKDNEYWSGSGMHDYLANKIPFVGAGVKNFNHPGTICGARGCIQACMMHLESQGKLSNKFKKPFRRRAPWKLAFSAEENELHSTVNGR